MQRRWPQRLWYEFLRYAAWLAAIPYLGLRARGTRKFPATGGVLVLANHQSNADPPLIGCVCPRRMNYLARESLFHHPWFRWLILSLDAIPIDREGLGLEGIKQTMKRLKAGEVVLMFPEGTRTPHGRVQPLKPGFLALVRRTGAAIVPVGLAGLYEAWPRSHSWPSPGWVQIEYGEPLFPQEIQGYDDDTLLAELTRRLTACQATAQALRAKRQEPL
ncbi:MAG: lysophospholipid acyltransferase family protein [Pirellulales bacterium]|nr:lysophospholipid acyltransferase family protein [Pirellulales bacterium]